MDGRYYLGIDCECETRRGGRRRAFAVECQPTEAEKGPDHGMRNIYRVADDAVSTSGVGWDEIVGWPRPAQWIFPPACCCIPTICLWDELPIRQLVADQFNKPAISKR